MEEGPYVPELPGCAEGCTQCAITSTGHRRGCGIGASRRRRHGGVVCHPKTLTVGPCRKACLSPCRHDDPDCRDSGRMSGSPCPDRAAARSAPSSGSHLAVSDPSQSDDRVVEIGNAGRMPVRWVAARLRCLQVGIPPTPVGGRSVTERQDAAAAEFVPPSRVRSSRTPRHRPSRAPCRPRSWRSS
jgi:hypothetical protein